MMDMANAVRVAKWPYEVSPHDKADAKAVLLKWADEHPGSVLGQDRRQLADSIND